MSSVSDVADINFLCFVIGNQTAIGCIGNMDCIENKLVTWKDYEYHYKKSLPLAGLTNASIDW